MIYGDLWWIDDKSVNLGTWGYFVSGQTHKKAWTPQTLMDDDMIKSMLSYHILQKHLNKYHHTNKQVLLRWWYGGMVVWWHGDIIKYKKHTKKLWDNHTIIPYHTQLSLKIYMGLMPPIEWFDAKTWTSRGSKIIT